MRSPGALLAAILALGGCDAARALLDHPTVRQAPRAAVISRAPPKAELSFTVEDERDLARLARQLGVTTAELLRDNPSLGRQPLQTGQVLRVVTSQAQLDAVLTARAERRAAAAKRAAEAEQARLQARRDAEARKRAPRKVRKRAKRKPSADKTSTGKTSTGKTSTGKASSSKAPTPARPRPASIR
jgi:hypothetical protein